MNGVKIINNTKLSYQELGYLIDHISITKKHNYKEEDYLEIKFKETSLSITIRYLKNSSVWKFDKR